MEILGSALKHEVDASDALHAAVSFVIAFELGDDPKREMRLGFDTQGRLLEVVVVTNAEGSQYVIHAMKARRRYIDLMP